MCLYGNFEIGNVDLEMLQNRTDAVEREIETSFRTRIDLETSFK